MECLLSNLFRTIQTIESSMYEFSSSLFMTFKKQKQHKEDLTVEEV